MNWTPLDNWIVLVGVLSAVCCALPGTFLVLRRMSMMGDAISHAVLPGLAAAFLLSGSRNSLPMLVGAAIVGLLTALFTQAIARHGAVEESASMGVVFTSLFALGLLMVVRAADAVDLDPGCVLYGSLELTPLDQVRIAGVRLPRVVLLLGGVLIANLLVLGCFYKELKVSSFDPELATTLGYSASFLHYLLMTMVALTAVACFESVGSILVIAMLVVPGATALLLADRLYAVLAIAVLAAAASGVLGHVAAIVVPGWWGLGDTSTSGMMAVMAGLLFLLALVFGPRQGMVSRWMHRARLSLRIVEEDVLGLLYRLEELRAENEASSALLARTLPDAGWMRRRAVNRLRARGAVKWREKRLRLSDKGRTAARSLIRSHRLWELYLYQHMAIPADHVHASAERLEHVTGPAMRRDLAESVASAQCDPQGKQIPDEP